MKVRELIRRLHRFNKSKTIKIVLEDDQVLLDTQKIVYVEQENCYVVYLIDSKDPR